MLAPGITLRAATVEELIALRQRELRPGRPRATAELEGDREPGARHFGAFLEDGGENVGCASLVPSAWGGAPAYRLRGMATRADLVGRGIGTALLDFADASVRAETGVVLRWCHARVGAVVFYRRLGWEVVSEVFDVPDVGPHHVMIRR
jgi:GNAT superfamily N-acetyltransferase